MAEESFKRKLTAILSADVEGYTRLMGEDEDATIRTLTNYRELMSTLIQKHRGRVVDSPGDNLLAEFGSVVDAVRCAVEIQEELRVRNAELPENRRMAFRIGVNLGDVIEEGERIYGDGVNIAARVEGLADGGGICISGTVYDSIKNKLSLSYESLGEHNVKNIKEPVRVYRMRVGPDAEARKETRTKRWRWVALAAIIVLLLIVGAVAIWYFYLRLPSVEPASEERMAFPLPEKPSIAVLPFANISGDLNQDFISDGITDQIITHLSMHPSLFVIARNSVFTYKGRPVKVQQVAEDLGIRYVLEGSVQSIGDRLRLTAQLIDTLTGKHLWAESYDRDREDIFALQDEITAKIFEELNVKLLYGEKMRGEPKSLEYNKKMAKAYSYFLQYSPESMKKAQLLFEDIIELYPESVSANIFLAWINIMRVQRGISKSPTKDLQKATELMQKSIALNDSHPVPHSVLGRIYFLNRQYEKAVEEVELAVALAPNDADSQSSMGDIYAYVGKREEAITACKRAIRLNPHPPPEYYSSLGRALCLAGQYEEAIIACKKALHLDPKYFHAMLILAIAYSLSGRDDKASAMVPEMLIVYPRFSVKRFEKRSPYKNQADNALFADVMRKIGVPD